MIVLTACGDEDLPSQDSLAMEAWIDSDGYPVVMLTRVVHPTTRPIEVKEVMERWAKVTISDGEHTVVMTGGWDESVFPPYSYRTFQMKGKVGTTYTICAESEDLKATASATILPPAEISEVRFADATDDMMSGRLIFKAPDAHGTCCYVVYTRVRNRETRHYPSFLGSITSSKPGEICDVPLYRGKHTDDTEEFTPNFFRGDTVDVILARVEEEVYRFWDDYNDQVYFGDNIFISSSPNLKGNVIGGYGVFSARGVDRRIVIVK